MKRNLLSAFASDEGLMHEADLLLEQMEKAERREDSQAVLAISSQHLEVWGQLADRGYKPVNTNNSSWIWQREG